jgi:hypothetical protein
VSSLNLANLFIEHNLFLYADHLQISNFFILHRKPRLSSMARLTTLLRMASVNLTWTEIHLPGPRNNVPFFSFVHRENSGLQQVNMFDVADFGVRCDDFDSGEVILHTC